MQISVASNLFLKLKLYNANNKNGSGLDYLGLL